MIFVWKFVIMLVPSSQKSLLFVYNILCITLFCYSASLKKSYATVSYKIQALFKLFGRLLGKVVGFWWAIEEETLIFWSFLKKLKTQNKNRFTIFRANSNFILCSSNFSSTLNLLIINILWARTIIIAKIFRMIKYKYQWKRSSNALQSLNRAAAQFYQINCKPFCDS